MRLSLLALLVVPALLMAGDAGSRAHYVGGTVPELNKKADVRVSVLEGDWLTVKTPHQSLEIPYKDITNVEYGLRVSRRYIEAALISPVFLVAKKRSHFLTIEYQDPAGNHQAMVLEVSKDDIRPLLVSLEARTGRKIDYQDEEARRAGRG